MNTRKIIEAIYYLLSGIRSHAADKIQLVKLIYLADKYHLVHYGRTITGDNYYAMQYGPVGSVVKDVLERQLPPAEARFFLRLAECVGTYTFKRRANAPKIGFEHLAETDKKALDFVLGHFGDWQTWRLVEYTHGYPEWKRFERKLKEKKSHSERIETEELFSLLSADRIRPNPSQLQSSKEIFTGQFE